MTALGPIDGTLYLSLPIAACAALAWRAGSTVLAATCAVVAMRTGTGLVSGSFAHDPAWVVGFADLVWFAVLLRIALTSAEHYPLLLAAGSLIGVLAHGLNLMGWVAHPPALTAILGATVGVQVFGLALGGIGLTRQSARRAAQAL